jgi:hypothetical protein
MIDANAVTTTAQAVTTAINNNAVMIAIVVNIIIGVVHHIWPGLGNVTDTRTSPPPAA